jgi:hypothetical protein
MNDEQKKELLKLARERYADGVEREQFLIQAMHEDFEFLQGDQWDPAIATQRQQDKRPCYTVNNLPQFVNQILNNVRKQKPSLKTLPVDDTADIETAKVYNGIIRNVETQSQANIAYDTSAQHSIIAGRGFIRVVTDHVSYDSMDQEIRIQRVLNPFSVVLGPHFEPTARDVKWGFVVDEIPRENFKVEFPNSKTVKDAEEVTGWDAICASSYGWISDNIVRVAEYFYKEDTDDEVMRLEDGSVWLRSDWEEQFPDIEPVIAQPVKNNSRKTVKSVWKWARITGDEVLDDGEWLGQFFPIVPVLGNEALTEEGLMLSGIVRNAKDPQKIFNAAVSTEMELIALAPKAPFIAGEGQITEKNKAAWMESNLRSSGVLTYKPATFEGNLLPPPQRAQFAPDIGALSALRQQSFNDIKSAIGLYDDNLGNRSNGQSGRAIIARQEQGDNANFQYGDNLARAIQQVGVIIVDLIPRIYNKPQAISILGEDGEQELVEINRVFSKDGKRAQHNLSEGKYNVVVTVGPTFASRRAEQSEAMLELAVKYPAIMEKAPDLVFKALDFPGAEALAERFAPPDMMGKDAKPEQMLQQAKQVVDTLKQQLQALDAHSEQLEQQMAEMDDEMKKLQLENKDKQTQNQLAALRIKLDKQKMENDFYIEKKRLKLTAAKNLSDALNDGANMATANMAKEIKETDMESDLHAEGKGEAVEEESLLEFLANSVDEGEDNQPI